MQAIRLTSDGRLLTQFLEYYGICFDFVRHGISVENGGFHFLRTHIATNHMGGLGFWIEDPYRRGENIAASSFAAARSTAAFEDAFFALRRFTPSRFAPTKLSRMLHPAGHSQAWALKF